MSPQAQAEPCPMCGGTDTRPPTKPGVDAWACDCGTNWATATTTVNLRCDRAGDSARWVLQQIVQLADQMPELTDRELRQRLLALAECSR